MWAIWETEPSGATPVWRADRTPAMKVEATAPSPGVSTPSLPVAGAMFFVMANTIRKLQQESDVVKQL